MLLQHFKHYTCYAVVEELLQILLLFDVLFTNKDIWPIFKSTICHILLFYSLDHPDLLSDESLDELLTKKFDAKARLTEMSVNDLFGHWQ